MTGTLKRISAGTYRAEDGSIIRLAPVDRKYECKKAPVYFLQKIVNGKAQYLSGVFKTTKPDTFSADRKDSLGVKTFYEIRAKNNGEELEIIARPYAVK